MSAKTRTFSAILLLSLGGACSKQPSQPSSATPDDLLDGPAAPSRAAPQASPLVKEAEGLLAKGDAASARSKFEEALAQNPGDARAALGLGLACESLGDAGAAEAAYRKAIAADDNLAEAHNNLALVLRDQGKDAEAIAELEQALRADPRLASAQANLALAYEDEGKAAEARAAYEKAVQLAPKDAMLHANYGLFLLAQNEPDAAVSVLRKGLAVGAGDRAALVAVGNGLRRAGKPDEAVRALRGAIDAEGGQPTAALLSELALAQNSANDGAAAKASLEQALQLDPKYATAHYLLGSMLASDGDMKGAAEHYKACIALDPRGELAAKAKQKLEAVKKAQK